MSARSAILTTDTQQQQAVGSILESDLFKNRDEERERMMQMFTNEPMPNSLNDRVSNSNAAYMDAASDDTSSLNDRMDRTNASKAQRHHRKRD